MINYNIRYIIINKLWKLLHQNKFSNCMSELSSWKFIPDNDFNFAEIFFDLREDFEAFGKGWLTIYMEDIHDIILSTETVDQFWKYNMHYLASREHDYMISDRIEKIIVIK